VRSKKPKRGSKKPQAPTVRTAAKKAPKGPRRRPGPPPAVAVVRKRATSKSRRASTPKTRRKTVSRPRNLKARLASSTVARDLAVDLRADLVAGLELDVDGPIDEAKEARTRSYLAAVMAWYQGAAVRYWRDAARDDGVPDAPTIAKAERAWATSRILLAALTTQLVEDKAGLHDLEAKARIHINKNDLAHLDLPERSKAATRLRQMVQLVLATADSFDRASTEERETVARYVAAVAGLPGAQRSFEDLRLRHPKQLAEDLATLLLRLVDGRIAGEIRARLRSAVHDDETRRSLVKVIKDALADSATDAPDGTRASTADLTDLARKVIKKALPVMGMPVSEVRKFFEHERGSTGEEDLRPVLRDLEAHLLVFFGPTRSPAG
jgi:hypothetical protein